LREHAEAWNATAHQELFEALRRGDKYIDGCPLRAIREVQEDGSQILIGDFCVERESNDVPWLAELKRTTKLSRMVTVLLCGYWAVSSFLSLRDRILGMTGMIDYLEPGHHRKGIMSLVVSTLIKTWMIPRMNCHRIAGTALIGNRASIKVFLNNGFVQQEDIPDWAPIPEGRGGGKMGLHVLRWSLKSEDGCTEASE